MSNFKKSSFSVTCDRLKKYIKEKKSFSENNGVLNLNAIISQETAQGRQPTLELFPGIEFKEENKTCTTKPGIKTLTILYNGEVVNYDNIDAKKAEEFISFATSITASYSKSKVAMPMTRRKSLQRFLQKRKNRISFNSAPYPSKQAAYDDKSWLQLGLSN